MQAFLITLLKCSVAMSVISLVYMAAMPLLSKRYTAKWRYYVWLVVVIGWILPFRPQLDAALFPVKMPTIQVFPVEHTGTGELPIMIVNEISRIPSIPLWWAVAGVWVIGVVGMSTYHAWRHGRFIKMVGRWSEDVTNSQTLGILDALKAEMKITTQVGLKTCPGITSPMLIGFHRPVILLPSVKIAADELALIFRHELVHLKRNDLWHKALVLLATAIHWFNPVVYIMAKRVAVQCEISCDELVLRGTSFQQRKQYGETIIGVVRNGAKLQTALSTNYYGGKKGMKTRIFSIMDTTKKKAGVVILCVALITIIGAGTIFTVDASSPNDAPSKQTLTAATGTGEPEVERPPYSDGERKSREEFLADAGLLKFDNAEHIYRFDGKWVRTINDKYVWNGRHYGGVSRSAGNYSGKPVDLKTVRNPETNKIERLVEMPEEETQLVVKDLPAEKVSNSMDNYSELLTKVENDPVKYYYNGRWVRSLYDANSQNSKSVLYFNAVEDKDVLGKTAIYLKTIRNEETNEIEKLVEMPEAEVFDLLGSDDDKLIIMSRASLDKN